MIYLAAPFFKPAQTQVVREIESLLDALALPYYSPRKDGRVLGEMTPDERRKWARSVFEKNVERMEAARMTVAVIDDFDPGTVWEVGFMYGLRLRYGDEPKIVTFSNHDHGLNVMLQECVDAHCRGIGQLGRCLKSRDFHLFRDFNAARVT